MRRLISTVGLPRGDWLRYRKKGITGTDAGAITGFNPYVSAFQVYQDKITDEISDFDNESMRQGRDLEAYVAHRFAEKTGLNVRRANAIFQNEEHPLMLADFDRLIVGQRAGLECKTVSPYSSDKWADDHIPLHYQMQVQHYLAVSGFDRWYIAALILGKELMIRQIDRDEELILYLTTIEERFWREHIEACVPPEPDGTKSCSEQIARMYFRADFEKSVELPGYGALLRRRGEVSELMDKLEREKNAIDQKVKLQMQDAAYATTEGFRVSWTNYESSRLDAKRLKAEQPEIYQKYSKSTQSRRFVVNPIKT